MPPKKNQQNKRKFQKYNQELSDDEDNNLHDAEFQTKKQQKVEKIQNQQQEEEDEDYKLALKMQEVFDAEFQEYQQEKQLEISNNSNSNTKEKPIQKQKQQKNNKKEIKQQQKIQTKQKQQLQKPKKKQKQQNNDSDQDDQEEQDQQKEQQQPQRRSSRRTNKPSKHFNEDNEEEEQEFLELLDTGRYNNFSNTWQMTDKQKISGRIKRAQTQKIYLLSAERNSDERWSFIIKGSQGKDYDLEISKAKLHCNCHDFRTRKKCCKHIFFIISRIAQNEPFLTKMKQNPKLTNEQYEILDVCLVQRLQERLQQKQTDKSNKLDINEIQDKEDRDCPICFDELVQNDIDRCSICKKFLHGSCIEEWLKTHTTCPLCRSEWHASEENVEGAFQKLKDGNIKI